MLRLYAWRPAALSLGYFQDAAVVDFAACQQAGVDVVRRPTGGRAVLHDAEVTYAIVLPPGHPLANLGITAAYKALSAGLLCGLARLRVSADLALPEHVTRADAAASAAHPGLQAACFDAPSWYELTTTGRKLIGSAQVRRNGALLQHGSVPLHVQAERIYSLLQFADDAARSKAARNLAGKAVGLSDLMGRPFTWQEVAAALATGVQEAFGCILTASQLTPEELACVRELERRHSDATWVLQRGKGVKDCL